MPVVAKKYNLSLFSEQNIKKNILPKYNLEKSTVLQVKFKDTAKQRAVYKITFNSKSYCLKKIYFPLEEFLFVYSAIEWFYRYNINVPRILPAYDGKRYVLYENMIFILTPWIDGVKCDYDNTHHVLTSSSNLAKMHTCSKNFFPINGSDLRCGYSNTYHSVSKHFNQLLKFSNYAYKYDDNFSNLFLQNFDKNKFLAEFSSEIGSTINFNNLSKSLCHMDYVNKNLIFENDTKIWVIDFDKCRLDYCVHDMSYFYRRLLKRDVTKWDLNVLLSSLAEYEKIHTLNIDEYKYILMYLAFPQKFWKLSRDYYNNIKQCNKKAFLSLLKKSIRNNESQIEFVKNFARIIEYKFNARILKKVTRNS